MNQREKVSYLKALLFIALADDTVDENEFKYFRRIGQMYELSPDELEEIKASVVEKKETIESIIGGITERQTKLTLIYELVALCYVDGNYSLAEKTGIQDICNLMGVESEKLEEIEELMKENINLQKKINIALERGES